MKKALFAAALSLLLCACADSQSSTVPDTTSTVQTTELTTAFQPENTTVGPQAEPVSLLDYLNGSDCGWVPFLRELSADRTLICEGVNKHYSVYTYDTKTGEKSGTLDCDTMPVCDRDGFWTLTAATDADAAVIHRPSTMLDTSTWSEALVYNYDLQQTHAIALPKGLRTEGFDIETATAQICWSLTEQDADGTLMYRLKSADGSFADSKTVCEQSLQKGESNQHHLFEIVGDRLIFKGGYSSSPNVQTKPAFGWLSLSEGHGPAEHRKDGCDYGIAFFDSGAYVFDANYPPNLEPSGRCTRIADGESNTIPLKSKQESLHVYPSAAGGYFATAMKGQNPDGSDISRITVYGAYGDLLNTFDIPFANDGRHYTEAVYVFDFTRTVYVQTIHAGVDDFWYAFRF